MDSVSVISSVVLLLAVVMIARGQVSIAPQCSMKADGSGPEASIEVTNGDTKYVHILACTIIGGPVSGASDVIDMTACSISWDVPFAVFVTDNMSPILGTDFIDNGICRRNTDPVTAVAGVTVTPSTVTSSVTDDVPPVVTAHITAQGAGCSGTAVITATLGDQLSLNMCIDSQYTGGANGYDMMIEIIDLNGDDLTLSGCQNVDYWGPVEEVAQGEYKVDFTAFMGAPLSTTYDIQLYTIYIIICAGSACTPLDHYDCTTGPYGPVTQYGRRRREASNEREVPSNATILERVQVTSRVTVSPFPDFQGSNDDVSINGAQGSRGEECEVCMQKSVMYGVTIVLVLVLILSLAVSCFLFVRARKSRKLLQDDSELTGSMNPNYRR